MNEAGGYLVLHQGGRSSAAHFRMAQIHLRTLLPVIASEYYANILSSWEKALECGLTLTVVNSPFLFKYFNGLLYKKGGVPGK